MSLLYRHLIWTARVANVQNFLPTEDEAVIFTETMRHRNYLAFRMKGVSLSNAECYFFYRQTIPESNSELSCEECNFSRENNSSVAQRKVPHITILLSEQ